MVNSILSLQNLLLYPAYLQPLFHLRIFLKSIPCSIFSTNFQKYSVPYCSKHKFKYHEENRISDWYKYLNRVADENFQNFPHCKLRREKEPIRPRNSIKCLLNCSLWRYRSERYYICNRRRIITRKYVGKELWFIFQYFPHVFSGFLKKFFLYMYRALIKGVECNN